MQRLVIFIGALLVTSSEPARSDPHAAAKARYATQADIDRLEKEISDQRTLIDRLVTLQTQYLKSLAALAQSAPAPAPLPPPAPPAASAEPEPQPAVAQRPPEPRPAADRVAVKPKPAAAAAPKGAGTILGRVKGGTAGETYVYVEDVAGPLAHGSAVMKQQNKQFVPRALVVQKGTQVEFPNMDAVFHNVFSVTPDNSFDLGSYRQGESKSVHVTKPGVISVYCNMHPEMVGYILVVPGGFYTRVGQDGFYKLAGVPAGHHRVVAWTPNARPTTAEVDVSDTDPATVELELHASRPGPHTNKDGMAYGSYRE